MGWAGWMTGGLLVTMGLGGCATGVAAGEDDGGVATGGATTGVTGGGGSPASGAGGDASTTMTTATGGAGGLGGAGGAMGVGGAGGMGTGGVGDTTPPAVASISPADGTTAVSATPTIDITFTEPMNPATVTSGATTTCSSTVQLSKDGFVTCEPLSAPTTTDDVTFSVMPAMALDSAETYALRVAGAEDTAGLMMSSPFETPTGLTVRYAHTIIIDGTNDFATSELVASSTPGGQLYVSYDDTHLYVGLAHSDIVAGGAGNKFAYFVFSGDLTFSTGNALSSDGKAKFGTAGTSKLNYHWKERIDGPNYVEWRIGNAVDWSTPWGTTGKSSARTNGFIEARIALDELANPATVVVTAYTIDYAGSNGDGWLYNMLNGAADGAAATPRSTYGYLAIPMPTSSSPNDPSLHLAF